MKTECWEQRVRHVVRAQVYPGRTVCGLRVFAGEARMLDFPPAPGEAITGCRSCLRSVVRNLRGFTP